MRTSRRRTRLIAAVSVLALALVASAPLSRAQEAALDDARDELDSLKGDLGAAIDRYEELSAELEEIQGRRMVIEHQVQSIAKDMLGLEDRAVKLAQELYKGGRIAELETLVSAKSIAEISTQLKYLETSGQAGLKVFGELASDRQQLEDRLDELDVARESAEAAVSEMEAVKAQIADAIGTQRDEIQELDAELAAQAEEVAAAPAPVITAPVPPSSSEADWDAIAMCESGGNWHLDGYYDGGLQFHPQTWLGYGGGKYARYAWQASREQQIAIAERVLDGQGPGAWPNCFQWK